LTVKLLALSKILTIIKDKAMKTTSELPPHLPQRLLLVPVITLAMTLSSAEAQQAPNYAPPASYQQNGGYQSQRQGVSERVGGFVKRLFYGERAPSYAPNTSASRFGYAASRSLDAPPQAYRPERSAPSPASRNIASAPPAAVTKKTQKTSAPVKTATTPGKYTPPKIKPDTSAPKSTLQPAAKPEPQKVLDEPPAPTLTPAPALNNQPTEPPATVASLTRTLPGMDPAPAPATAPEKTAPVTTSSTTPQKQPPTSTAASSGQFLVGKKTAVPGRVISPYPPHQELDVGGLASGSLALDPTTDKVFEIP
jgi:hypothetical protein